MKLPDRMQAMVLEAVGRPLVEKLLPLPVPGPQQVLIKIIACGVCRTDLHIIDGELKYPKLPLIPGHEIIGTVVGAGIEVSTLKENDIVGVPWLGYTCGNCRYCINGKENLCDRAGFTGYTIDGGYAEYTVAHEQYCIPLLPRYANSSAAPLLCAGLIGYRSYSMVGHQSEKIGIYGFGAAAHIIIQVATYQRKKIYAFTRNGDIAAQDFAKRMGAIWAGDSDQPSPEQLDAAIIFAPAGELIPKALLNLEKGGVVICGGIHMSDIPSFPYSSLWGERMIRSVANLTRQDGKGFFELASKFSINTETVALPLNQANEALESLRRGRIHGAVVLTMNQQ